MKSVRPQGQGFSQGSQRSGRPNQKRDDLFNPFSIACTSGAKESHSTILAAALCFAIFPAPPLPGIFHPPRKTLDACKSSEKTRSWIRKVCSY